MFLVDWFRSSKRRGHRRKMASARTRHLRIEPLERRELLTVTIKGEITVANLPCATADVPVSGAAVTATYTVGNNTVTKEAWTDKQGDYSIKLTSAAARSRKRRRGIFRGRSLQANAGVGKLACVVWFRFALCLSQ